MPKGDATALRKAISQQPVAVAICASMSLQFYHGGIVTDDQCCEGGQKCPDCYAVGNAMVQRPHVSCHVSCKAMLILS